MARTFFFHKFSIMTQHWFSLAHPSSSERREEVGKGNFRTQMGWRRLEENGVSLSVFPFLLFAFCLYLIHAHRVPTSLLLFFKQQYTFIPPIENDSPMDGGKGKELCTNRVGLKQEVSWKLRLHSHTHTRFSFHETRKDISKHYEWRLASVNAGRGVLTSFDKAKWDKFQSKAEEIEKSISVKRLNSFSGFLTTGCVGNVPT